MKNKLCKKFLDESTTGSNIVRFVVHDHKADRAGYHQDLRFQLPGSKNWASFAVPKGVPLKPGLKVLAIRTHDHTEQEALFTGDIPPGDYGGGTLTIFDEGICKLDKNTSAHIIITFQGNKLKGLYHLVSLGNVKRSKFKQRQYLLFKSKVKSYRALRLTDSELNKYRTVFKRFKNVRI
jgi:bifunctional non-homologous end joining protein LigD